MDTKCPTCGSKAPHLHPATQFEGEIDICADEFHLADTFGNIPAFRDAVVAKRKRLGLEAA